MKALLGLLALLIYLAYVLACVAIPILIVYLLLTRLVC